MQENLLDVIDLKIHFPVLGGVFRHKVGVVHAVDGVSFSIKPGQTLGLVGESGCGKTTLGRAIIKLYKPTSGSIEFNGVNIETANFRTMKSVRRDLQMIFQDPFESLNSRHTIGTILEEPFKIHSINPKGSVRDTVKKLLERVGLGALAIDRFPHEFSGGQRQRIGIARAIALNPKMIICDEPVSALDVSIQSQILNLLLELQKEMGLSYLFIAHDLAVVKHVSDDIGVMYLGKIVEYAQADRLYERPLHPYTKALISAIPVADPSIRDAQNRMHLKGEVPSPVNPPKGCRFNTRCPFAAEICFKKEPQLMAFEENAHKRHLVACHRVRELGFSPVEKKTKGT